MQAASFEHQACVFRKTEIEDCQAQQKLPNDTEIIGYRLYRLLYPSLIKRSHPATETRLSDCSGEPIFSPRAPEANSLKSTESISQCQTASLMSAGLSSWTSRLVER